MKEFSEAANYKNQDTVLVALTYKSCEDIMVEKF